MRKYDIVEVKQRQLVEWTCNVCGLDFIKDEYEAQEAFSCTQTGGYGSVFGDGNTFYIDLCQHCMKRALGEFVLYDDVPYTYTIGE